MQFAFGRKYVNIWRRVGKSPHNGFWEDHYLEDKEAESTEEIILQKERAKIVREVLHTLTPRQEDVLRKVYGVADKEQTEAEIGLDYGVTRQNINNIKQKALQRLRDCGIL